MLKSIWFIVLPAILFPAGSSGQQVEIKKHELIGEWYASNDDSLFFKADTLVLLKRTDSNVVLDRMCVSPDLARERGLLNCLEFVNLRFRSRGRFEMWLYEGYTSEVWLSSMNWRLKDDLVSIDANDLHWTFQIIEMDTVRFFDPKYSFFDKYADPRMKLVRIFTDSIVPAAEVIFPVSNSLRPSDAERMDSLDIRQNENILRNLKPDE